MKAKLDTLKENLTKRGFQASVFSNRNDAIDEILRIIPLSAQVAFGGSETVKELEIAEKLSNRGNNLLHRSFMKDGESAESIMRDSFFADWYLLSANAITEDGELVNTDGRANRVAATLYGPKNVLFIVGKNKVCSDINSAFERIKTVAAPKNCERLKKNNPCVMGNCTSCSNDTTICKATVIYHHPTTDKNYYVFLIDENLGY